MPAEKDGINEVSFFIVSNVVINFIQPPISASLVQQNIYNPTGFRNFNDLKNSHGSISIVADDRAVFNIMGNKYRLVVRIVFSYKVIQIKWFGTHKEYDQIDVATIQFKNK